MTFAKQQVWDAGRTSGRLQLYHKHPPKAVHPLTWRIDFDGRGRPTMDFVAGVFGVMKYRSAMNHLKDRWEKKQNELSRLHERLQP